MTINQWLVDSCEKLTAKGITNARRDSEIILSFILKQGRGFLIAHPDNQITPEQTKEADQLIGRRAKHEPIAYIVGQKEFFGLSFKTDARGLIPRWETELIIEKALGWLKNKVTRLTVADIGTGVGTIVCTLADRYPKHRYVATDSSKNVLTLAQENAFHLGLHNINFLHGNLAEPLIHSRLTHQINLITANLPYIRSSLLTELDPTIKYYEPDLALNGGEDGLSLYRQCIPQLKELVAPGGYLLFEHEYDQGTAMRQLIHTTFPKSTLQTYKDNLGHDRVTSSSLPEDYNDEQHDED